MRSLDDVEEVIASGANRAVLGTVALEDPEELERACARYGDRIAVSLDVTSGELASHGWTVGTGVPLEEALATFEKAGAASFIYTDIARDGTMSGPNLDGLRHVTTLTEMPVVASGGIGSLDELRAVARMKDEGVAGAIVGRALYEGKFTVGEANLAADETRAEET
jgi:phosphoribosylformimino-5-aminoimidazole carboxamide ribonucleotide (ProFAR) isomerase